MESNIITRIADELAASQLDDEKAMQAVVLAVAQYGGTRAVELLAELSKCALVLAKAGEIAR